MATITPTKSNMFPGIAFDYARYATFSNMELFSKFPVIHSAIVKFANFNNIIFCYLGTSIFNTYRSSCASFLYHIKNIIFSRSYKQMLWIYAAWIIAMVTNVKSFGEWAIMNMIRDTMCQPFFRLKSGLTISPAIFSLSPFPTWRCHVLLNRSIFINFIPKTLNKWYALCFSEYSRTGQASFAFVEFQVFTTITTFILRHKNTPSMSLLNLLSTQISNTEGVINNDTSGDILEQVPYLRRQLHYITLWN